MAHISAALLTVGLLISNFGNVAFAAPAELDNEGLVTNEQARLASDLPGTVVVRTDMTTGKVEILQTNENLPADKSAQTKVLTQADGFKAVSASERVPNELDRDSSVSSWYFFWYNYSYTAPSYYYYGYTYRYYPYYNYWWGNYAYSYYRWYGW